MSVPSRRFRSPPRSWNQRTPTRTRTWRRGALVAFFVVGFLALVWGWRITDVTVDGSTIIPNAAVRDAVLSELQGNWLGIFPRSSMILARPNRLERTLRQQFAFASASARRQRNGTLLVRVAEQTIAGIVEFDDGGRLLISNDGRILGPVPESLNGATGLIQWRASTNPMKTGGVFLPPDHASFLQQMWAELAQVANGALQPQFIGARAGSSTAFDIHTVQGTVVSVDADTQNQNQLTKLRSVLRELYSSAPPKSLHSIDLRYGDRVYVQ